MLAEVRLTADRQQIITTDSPIMDVSRSAALLCRKRPERRFPRAAALGWTPAHPAGRRVIPLAGDAADEAVTGRAAELAQEAGRFAW